ncbi:MAG: hydrogenase maturation nickel metallochaperone HypA [Campylobacter sp.]|nr:hydrogenase maturation nickel metallochaperone HypA [Campylobacter sp.]
MHELSIVIDLVDLCEKNLNSHKNASKIEEIIIKIGRLSGVESHYLRSAYSVYKTGTVCENATLTIHEQEVIVVCKECVTKSELKKFEFICPNCKSQNLEVIDGEDMYLMSMVIS